MPRTYYSNDQLTNAIEGSRSLLDVAKKLNIRPNKENYKNLERKIKELDLNVNFDLHHTWKYSEKELKEAVISSFSIVEVCRKLQINICGGNQATVKQRIAKLGLDTTHFTGQGWTRGKNFPSNKEMVHETVFVENSKFNLTSNSALRRKILKFKLIPYICKLCNLLGDWNNLPLTLQLDHINGVRTDNRLENLRFLCPNCHSQTSTYTGRNKKTK